MSRYTYRPMYIDTDIGNRSDVWTDILGGSVNQKYQGMYNGTEPPHSTPRQGETEGGVG